ncbi:hypothetical protein AURDEDRAFT_62026 [Auricularia subglabra TFB-10046 SS5]|nr:hypothetical protein AURDEDRAFT_62026 [Auricularia subglabra TFB-10046 SS5]
MPGSAGRASKKEVLQVLTSIGTGATDELFCGPLPPRIRTTLVDVSPNPNEPSRPVSRVVCEMPVEKVDMVDEHDNVAVGCLTWLVDFLSTLALVAQGAHQSKDGDYVGVSQSLQFVFHGTAPLGSKLRIDNTCIALAGRTFSARTEIWDASAERLICSALHIKMPPSQPKL